MLHEFGKGWVIGFRYRVRCMGYRRSFLIKTKILGNMCIDRPASKSSSDCPVNVPPITSPREECEVLWWVRLSFCLSVCLSARITRKPHGQTLPFLCMLPVACCHDSFLFSRRCDTWCASGFTDDVMFRRVRQVAVPVERQTTAVFGWVRQNAAPEQSPLSMISLFGILFSPNWPCKPKLATIILSFAWHISWRLPVQISVV